MISLVAEVHPLILPLVSEERETLSQRAVFFFRAVSFWQRECYLTKHRI